MTGRGNLFSFIPDRLEVEHFETILASSGFRVERILSRGHRSPEGFWYDQAEAEWVLLLQGSAGLRFEDAEEVLVLKPGDWVHIEKNVRHRVEWTDPDGDTIWLAIHYKDYNDQEKCQGE